MSKPEDRKLTLEEAWPILAEGYRKAVTVPHRLFHQRALLLEQVLGGLRNSVQNEEGGVSWSSPFASFEFAAPWEPGELPTEALKRNPSLLLLGDLLGWAASLEVDGVRGLLDPGNLTERELEARASLESQACRSILFQFSLGEEGGHPTVTPRGLLYTRLPDTFLRDDDVEDPGSLHSLVVAIEPLLLDPEAREVSCSVSASLWWERRVGSLGPKEVSGVEVQGSPDWNPEEREAFWESFLEGFELNWKELHRLAGIEDPAEPPPEETTLPATLPPPNVTASPPETRVFHLALSPVQVDHRTLEILKTLPRHGFLGRANSFPSWEENQARKVQEFLEAGPEEARDAGLLSVTYSREGKPHYQLTKAGKKELQLEIGVRQRGYRFTDDQGDEWLCRVVRHGAGSIRFGVSLFGQAIPLLADFQKEVQLAEEELGQSLPFLPPQDEPLRKNKAQMARAFQDGRELLNLAVLQMRQQGTSLIQLTGPVLRELFPDLNKERTPRIRIETALRALRNTAWHAETLEPIPGQELLNLEGGFLNGRLIEGRGEKMLVSLELDPRALVSLAGFFNQKTKVPRRIVEALKNPGKAVTQAPPIHRVVTVHSGRPIYRKAFGHSEEQAALADWIHSEITLNRDTARRGAPHKRIASKDDKEAFSPRVYGSDFCPLLPPGRRFWGALGHFRRNAEAGRTLAGTGQRPGHRGGSRSKGLMTEMGFHLEQGGGARTQKRNHALTLQALEDMRLVVEDHLEGKVVGIISKGDREGEWITLDEALQELLPPQLRKEVRWHLFVSENCWELEKHKFEELSREKAGAGEIPHAWIVTEDPEEARRSMESYLEGTSLLEDGSLPSSPLSGRLQDARVDRKLSQGKVAALFGVSQRTVSHWENQAKPIPQELVPLVERWLSGGDPPTPEELESRKTRRRGKRSS